MLKHLLAFALLASSPLVHAQLSLRNADVIHMVRANLNEDLIVTTVNAAPGYYDTSVEGLANLQRAGVTDKELSAIVQKAFHICFADTDKDHLEGLKQSQMEGLLQQFHCGPHFEQPPPPAAKTPPAADKSPAAHALTFTAPEKWPSVDLLAFNIYHQRRKTSGGGSGFFPSPHPFLFRTNRDEPSESSSAQCRFFFTS